MTPAHILVVNAGSSSVKLSVLDEQDNIVASETVAAPDGRVDAGALKGVIDRARPIDAVGHRIVHGGIEFTEPVLIDEGVVRRLEALTDLAPLHQPKSLHGLEAVSRILPDVPAVACFDTAFHATIPAAANTYALPAEWRRRWHLRRYGFHGLSHAYASRRAGQLVRTATGRGDGALLRVVTCHLGAGASLAAVRGGVSMDTTMGFTPLEGLVMATRSGSVDPGLVLWLEQHVGIPPAELASTLEQRSGLLGLTGTADMRQALEAEAAGDADAALGVGVYLHSLRAGIAAMVASLGGLDVLVFTGGVGEHSSPVRWRAAEGLGFLGVQVDRAANEGAANEGAANEGAESERAESDRDLSAAGAAVRTFVIAAREDKEIARGVRHVLEARPPGG